MYRWVPSALALTLVAVLMIPVGPAGPLRPIARIPLSAPYASGEAWIAPLGDLDGDERAELVLVGERNRVLTLYSSQTWMPLQPVKNIGATDAGDLDGAGIQDSFSRSEDGSLRGVSGRTGQVLLRFSGRWVNAVPAGDLDGDGKQDLTVSRGRKPTDPGELRIYSGADLR